MLKEIAKLGRVRVVGLPPDLFADTSEKLLEPGMRVRRTCTRLASGARRDRSG
jgi:hypothetical protein